LIIALPNSNSYDVTKYRAHWAAYDVPRHIWHFSPETFQLLSEKHGFKIKTVKKMPFDAFYISILSEKYLKRKCPLLRGVLFGIKAYFISLFIKEKSSSLVYVLIPIN
jgi:hypothetical protein